MDYCLVDLRNRGDSRKEIESSGGRTGAIPKSLEYVSRVSDRSHVAFNLPTFFLFNESHAETSDDVAGRHWMQLEQIRSQSP